MHAWTVVREVVTFGLGVAVILDALALTGGGRSMGELVVGLVMVGLLPLDRLLGAVNLARLGRRCPAGPPDT
jgi:hypothetical protein